MLHKLIDQAKRDKARKTYRVAAFPADLSIDTVIAALRHSSGKLLAGPLDGAPSLVFETLATAEGKAHMVRIPALKAEYVVKQLMGLIPGLTLVDEQEFPRRVWVHSEELEMRGGYRPLDIASPAQTATSLLTSMDHLRDGECVLMQWVIAPMRRPAPPVYDPSGRPDRDEVNDRREKLSEPNFNAVLRIAAVADTRAHAAYLVDNVKASLHGGSTPYSRFTRRRGITMKMLQARLDHASALMHWPIQLMAGEQAALLGWPLGDALINGMPQRASRLFPPSPNIQGEGLIIGSAAWPGGERPLAVGWPETLMHQLVTGETGTGKTVLLVREARQIMDAGYGLIVFETEGNLLRGILDAAPEERLDDFIIVDVEDTDNPVGLNVFDQGINKLTMVELIMDLFAHRYGNGLLADDYLYNGLHTIAESGLSVTDLPALLRPRADEVTWADEVTRSLTDPELARWWQSNDNRGRDWNQQRADPAITRIRQLSARPPLRHIFGQSRSSFRIADVLREHKILLFNFKGVGQDSAAFIATLMLDIIWHEIKAVPKETPVYVMLDEFGDMADLPVGFEKMTAQARKHNTGFILANQGVATLPAAIRLGLGNLRTRVSFNVGADDAAKLASDFGKHVGADDLMTQKEHSAIARILTPGGPSGPVSLRALPPERRRPSGGEAAYRSRRKYTRPVEDVKREIEGRRQTAGGSAKRRPRIGGAGWGGSSAPNKD